MNMSQSDNEEIDKDQLRAIEDNARKGTRLDKKRKRLENKGIKLDTDSDVASEAVSDEGESDAEGKLKPKGSK